MKKSAKKLGKNLIVLYNRIQINKDIYSVDERFAHTGNYLEDVRRANQMNDLIRETVINEVIYAD